MAKQRKLVPECGAAIEQWKYEIAAELGLAVGRSVKADTEFASELGTVTTPSYGATGWGHLSSRETGAVGGEITRRLIRQAQQASYTLS